MTLTHKNAISLNPEWVYSIKNTASSTNKLHEQKVSEEETVINLNKILNVTGNYGSRLKQINSKQIFWEQQDNWK